MKSLATIMMAVAVLVSTQFVNAQMKNERTETVKINGNCGMCKTNIEKAGNVKNEAKVNWNKETKMATITYNSEKTDKAAILKRIGLAGYDSEAFRAPDEAYAKLAECCQYERAMQTMVVNTPFRSNNTGSTDHSNHGATTTPTTEEASQLNPVFDNYFAVKDALVQTNAGGAATKATALVTALKAVDMGKLGTEEHNVWMKVMKNLTADAEKIAGLKDIEKQREVFVSLSKNMYELAKVSKHDKPVYYQHCPMYKGGSNWLSLEEEIKNPFYGSKMMTCGSVKETLK